MAFFIISMLNGLSYGLLLFMLSSGLTLILSMMGVLNFAHASFYMLGAYLGLALSKALGFVPALLIAPLLVAGLGAWFESVCLRRVHALGHVSELLLTFGAAYVVLELVQLVWGRMPQVFLTPEGLQGPLFTLIHGPGADLSMIWQGAPGPVCAAPGVQCSPFPATRALMMLVSLGMLLLLWLLLKCTRFGLVIQAALTHPHMVECLGHNVPRVFTWVFGLGAGLAGLAGVIGGSTFVTEPAMAATVGSLVFVVVVVGGMGSLWGAFAASLLIGLLQTFAVAIDHSLASLATDWGWALSDAARSHPLARLTVSQVAPVLPYGLLVLVLLFRPKGLLGTRAG